MEQYLTKEIIYTFNEYKQKYRSLLNQYLDQHVDFDESQFIDIEIDFYGLCYDTSNILQSYNNDDDTYSYYLGHCRFHIRNIYDSLITFEEEYNGFDFELSQKYKATFSKIITFLEQKKNEVNNPKRTSYNYVLLECKSPEIESLFINILHNGISLFNAINQINKITTPETYVLFLNEFETIYNYLLCSFMRSVEVSTIEQALEIFEDELEFVYVDAEDLPHLAPFLRDIGKYKTVYNSFGLSSTVNDNAIKLVHLNNLMIDYYNGFFESPKKEFEHMIELKTVYNYLNNEYINKYFGKTTLHTVITKALPENNAPNNNLIENKNILIEETENDFLKSTIVEHLEEFVNDIKNNGYEILVNALSHYFKYNEFPVLKSKINFTRINKKRVGWALKELYKSQKMDILAIEYFRFAQENINLFEREIIETENFNKSKFYKMFTTNPAK